MKTALLCFACLPLGMVGGLLMSGSQVVDRELAGGSVAKSDPHPQSGDSQSSSARSQKALPGYGDISGQILFDGEAPVPKVLFKQDDGRVKDAEICAAHDMKANDLLVDPKTKGIANVFVYIYPRNIKRQGIKIHPDERQTPTVPLVVNVVNCRFTPHAVVARTGQKVVVKSADTCSHHPHPYLLRNVGFGGIVGPGRGDGGEIMEREFGVAETLPMPVTCDIHPWMKAYWLVVDHPYAAVTDKEGRFKIGNLPVGEIEFRIWHEIPGYIVREYVVTVAEGQTRLAPVKVSASRFLRSLSATSGAPLTRSSRVR